MPRSGRKAHNQALFRQVNEHIADAAARFELDAGAEADFIWECDHLGCTQLVRLSVGGYVLVRNDATLFLVLPGHEDPEHETVLVDEGSYLILRTKPGVTVQAG
jgi:hypothetical protein